LGYLIEMIEGDYAQYKPPVNYKIAVIITVC